MTEATPPRVGRLVGYYERAARNMQGLPMYNAALSVEAVGFREHEGRLVGVIVTPWFMNLAVLPCPADLEAWRKGSPARVSFPSGEYEFMVGDAGDNGLIATCSLFSLMCRKWAGRSVRLVVLNLHAIHEVGRVAEAGRGQITVFFVMQDDAFSHRL